MCVCVRERMREGWEPRTEAHGREQRRGATVLSGGQPEVEGDEKKEHTTTQTKKTNTHKQLEVGGLCVRERE